MIICVVAMLRACLSLCIPTVTGIACGNAKFRLVMLIGSALIAKCIEHSSGYLRIREYFSIFLCHKCEYSVIADALPSFEEKTTNTLQLKVSSDTPEEVDHY